MNNKSSHINNWLLPLSWMYGIVMWIRNKLFEWKILKRQEYEIPVICVGNITVGGTGKTPHIEYLISLLKTNYNIAVLSRGYKRKTKGFLLADNNTDYTEIGDEPFQIKSKFPDITVAVDENRNRGISTLLNMKNKPEIILLDDAFQHLYVKPSYSILLMDYNRPIYEDTLLPAGRLRESIDNSERANMIIVTKCPENLKPIDMRIITHGLNIYPYQTLLFTRVEYSNLVSMFSYTDLFNKKELTLESLMGKKVLLLTGIASPKNILEEIKKYTDSVKLLAYPDHHNFTEDDIRKMEAAYREMNDKNVITIVTEKDAVRLMNRKGMDREFSKSLYYLPIKIKFINEKEALIFNRKIYRHVRKNPRNSELYQETGD